ncbi:hypothetical protein PPACK8108_LOCUS23019 [Phakopsora pachyrhizi]|uniref:CCHC-type domain-containing protein n=1 Tax=Phakopsora pachyrhizi TaxID=170000 RepID=A0AAV0BN10_PHAPC|nr:hypothetical protein PPACK8108_LOCUS23019 [Phakopsora pachyrhizi]
MSYNIVPGKQKATRNDSDENRSAVTSLNPQIQKLLDKISEILSQCSSLSSSSEFSAAGKSKFFRDASGLELKFNDLILIHHKINEVTVPSWVTCLPKNIGLASAGTPKAAEWLVLYLDRLKSYRINLRDYWVTDIQPKPTLHIAKHMEDIIRLFGTPSVYLAWSGERRALREVLGGFCWIFLAFEDEGVAVEGNEWLHLKEEQKLGGGAHQSQSSWSKTTGAMDFFYGGVQRFRKLCRRSTEPDRGSTEVGGGFITEASRRLWRAAPEVFYGGSRRFIWSLKRKEEEVKELPERRHNFPKKKSKAWEERSTETGRALAQEAAGKTSRRVYKSTREERRVSRGYQEERKWFPSISAPLRRILFLFLNPGRMSGLGGTEAGPAGPSRSEATIRKVVNIPKEEKLIFDGKGFHQFLHLFEMQLRMKGQRTMTRDLKEEVMEMKGWREIYWGKLVKEMKARWGRYRPAPRYTIQEFWTAVDGWEKKGGVSSKGKYEERKEQTFRNEDEACPLLWRALSKELQEMAKFSLIKGKKMVENRSGGYSFSTLKELKLAVNAEMKFKGEIIREELNKKRNKYRGKDREESKKDEEKKKEPEAVDNQAKKLDQMTDILKSFIGQTVERITEEGREVYEARGSGSFVCCYCGMQGHASTRCPRVEKDIKNGLLTDNTRVHYDRTRTFRSVVTAHSSKVPLEKFTTQGAELLGPRVQEPGIIHLPEPLHAKEDSFVSPIVRVVS